MKLKTYKTTAKMFTSASYYSGIGGEASTRIGRWKFREILQHFPLVIIS